MNGSINPITGKTIPPSIDHGTETIQVDPLPAATTDVPGPPPADPLAQVDLDWMNATMEIDGVTVDCDVAPDAIPDELRRRFCDWYGHTMLMLDAETERARLQFEAIQKRADNRRKSLEAFWAPRVQEMLGATLNALPGKKKPRSLDLDRCKIGLRVSPTVVSFQELDAVRNFAETFEYAGTAYKAETTKTVAVPAAADKAALKDAVMKHAQESGGAFPPGIELVGGEDVMYVKAPA